MNDVIMSICSPMKISDEAAEVLKQNGFIEYCEGCYSKFLEDGVDILISRYVVTTYGGKKEMSYDLCISVNGAVLAKDTLSERQMLSEFKNHLSGLCRSIINDMGKAVQRLAEFEMIGM